MTETTGEIKPIPRLFEENAYKYADEQAELYRGLKEPSGGYANIVDAYIAGATKETAELEQQIEKMKCCGNCIHCYEGAYHNGYRCKDHARESVCDNWEIMTDEIRKEMLKDDL